VRPRHHRAIAGVSNEPLLGADVGWCPACRRSWPAATQACPECLAGLVGDLDATVPCRHCGREWPSRMQSCPECLAEVAPDPAAVVEALADTLALGGRVWRPPGVAAFASGPDSTLLRISAGSALLFAGRDELLEASVVGAGHRAVAPLRCLDADGSTLFSLDRYEPADRGLVAIDAEGAPLGTYLRWSTVSGAGLDVRDETSAPAARLGPCRRPDADFELVETGGGLLATCARSDVDLDGWVDDQWSLRVRARLPLRDLAAVAMLLAAKVLLGRPVPVRSPDGGQDDDGEELPWG
ncbi:MAG: hypothetical protein ACR2HV_01550, partial [Acidimicrobiales bacterium]